MSFRSLLYSIAKYMGDYNAVRKDRVGQRLYNRGIGRFFK